MASWLDGFFENRSWLKIIQYDNNTNELTVAGSSISEKARFTLAKLPPASLVDIGSVVNIPKSEFSNNTGIPDDGIYLKADGVNWITAYPGQIFSMQDGTNAAPLATYNAATLGVSKALVPLTGGNPTIPWQLMHVGMRLRITSGWKFGANTTFAIFGNCFGRVNNDTNAYAGYINTSAASNKPIQLVSEIYVSSSTGYTVSAIIKNHPTGTPTEGYFTDSGGALAMTTFGDHYINFSVDPAGADTSGIYYLMNYKVELIS